MAVYRRRSSSKTPSLDHGVRPHALEFCVTDLKYTLIPICWSARLFLCFSGGGVLLYWPPLARAGSSWRSRSRESLLPGPLQPDLSGAASGGKRGFLVGLGLGKFQRVTTRACFSASRWQSTLAACGLKLLPLLTAGRFAWLFTLSLSFYCFSRLPTHRSLLREMRPRRATGLSCLFLFFPP